jgi:hypothetical protein
MKTGLDQSINDNTVKNYNFKIFYVIVAQTIHFPIIGEMEILKEEKVLIVFYYNPN